VPGLFQTQSFRDELETMFPEKDAAFYHIGRYLFHPSNAVTSYYRANLAGRRVGIQIRVFYEKQPQEQLLSCVRDEELLPNTTASTSNDTSVLVTSLSSWYYERIRGEYGGRVNQPSHEGVQRSGDAAHNVKALSEMYLLSMCDVLVTSGFSTFGYVAQGLAGLRPWVMARPPWWAKDWREGLDPQGLPCRRMASVEPCFQCPSTAPRGRTSGWTG
jgi:xyloglucan fucosyltransferase